MTRAGLYVQGTRDPTREFLWMGCVYSDVGHAERDQETWAKAGVRLRLQVWEQRP